MFRNVGSNWLVTLATIAVTYVLTPFVIRALGMETYGTWVVITSLTGYLGLLVLGVPMASVRYFAQHVAEGDEQRLNAAIGSCAALYFALGVGALVVGAGLFGFFVHTYTIPAEIRHQAHLAFGVAVAFVAAGFIGLLPEGILAAHDEFVRRNQARLATLALRFALTVGLLTLAPSLLYLSLTQLACLVFDFAACWWLIRRRYPGTRLRPRDLDWTTMRRIVAFSVYVLVLNAGARLAFETDSLVIGAYMDVGSIPYFTVANSLIIYLMDFVVAIAAVAMPMATRLKTLGRMDELRENFLKWSKIALSLTLVAGLFLLVMGPRFIAWWIDPSFEAPAGPVLQVLMVSYLVFLPVRGVALPILMGLGKPGLVTIGFFVAGVVNLGLSIALARPLGLVGVALGTAIPNVLFAALTLTVTCRELGTPVSRYLTYVVPRAAVGALPVAALLVWLRDILDTRSPAGMAGAGVAMMLLFAVTSLLFVYRNDPYVDLRTPLSRLLTRRS